MVTTWLTFSGRRLDSFSIHVSPLLSVINQFPRTDLFFEVMIRISVLDFVSALLSIGDVSLGWLADIVLARLFSGDATVAVSRSRVSAEGPNSFSVLLISVLLSSPISRS